jgi:hypothetical protein
MGSGEVVVLGPRSQGEIALIGVRPVSGVGPLAQGGLDEAFGFAGPQVPPPPGFPRFPVPRFPPKKRTRVVSHSADIAEGLDVARPDCFKIAPHGPHLTFFIPPLHNPIHFGITNRQRTSEQVSELPAESSRQFLASNSVASN